MNQKPIRKPLTLRQIKYRADEDDRLTVRVSISLDNLVDFNLESLNNYMDDAIIDSSVIGCLSDISYKVIEGSSKKSDHSILSGSIILEVNADISNILEDN